jgi:DNA polymerase-3 subunit epsilon
MNYSNRIGIIDIETTGFIGRGSIVEIGIASLDLDTGKVKIVFDSLCCEDVFDKKHYTKPLGWIFENSDLTPEEVWEAPRFLDIKEEVQDLISSHAAVTAFNRTFDFKFLESRDFIIESKAQCAMQAAHPICKIPNRSGRKGYKWPNVEEAWKFFFPEVEYYEKHRGGDDARHEAYIVYELWKLGAFSIEE